MERKHEIPDSVREELEWLSVTKRPSKFDSSISSYLPPIGCAVTAGILARGMYHMYKRNPEKQQLFMRYRVLAQGVTVVIAAVALLQLR